MVGERKRGAGEEVLIKLLIRLFGFCLFRCYVIELYGTELHDSIEGLLGISLFHGVYTVYVVYVVSQRDIYTFRGTFL